MYFDKPIIIFAYKYSSILTLQSVNIKMLSKSFVCIALAFCVSAALGSPISNYIAQGDGIIPEKGQYPYQVLIYFRYGTNDVPTYRCGGTIISNRHILTTAECFETNYADATVLLGDGQRVAVKKVTQHPLYSDKKNNIAILELVNSLNSSELVKPVVYNNTHDVDNEEVTALGVQRVPNTVVSIKKIININEFEF